MFMSANSEQGFLDGVRLASGLVTFVDFIMLRYCAFLVPSPLRIFFSSHNLGIIIVISLPTNLLLG
jgi:hypothetical protein